MIDKLKHDLLAECLREVFQLAAAEGESMATWTSRVQEAFGKCCRKVSVDFPPEARGWICLNAAGLSEDQRAIVTAKTQGDLKFETVVAAMRSCFPDYKAKGRTKTATAFLVDDANDGTEPSAFEEAEPAPDAMIYEIEAFLTEHGASESSGVRDEIFDEAEVAEILAATWKEKRAEISKLQSPGSWCRQEQSRSGFLARHKSFEARQSAGSVWKWDIGREIAQIHELQVLHLVSRRITLTKNMEQLWWWLEWQLRKRLFKPSQRFFWFLPRDTGWLTVDVAELWSDKALWMASWGCFMIFSSRPSHSLVRLQLQPKSCSPNFYPADLAHLQSNHQYDQIQWSTSKTKCLVRHDQNMTAAKKRPHFDFSFSLETPPHKLNQHRLSMIDQLRNKKQAEKQADFCAKQAEKQLKRGGRVLIEHPWSSQMWQYGRMKKVVKQMH